MHKLAPGGALLKTVVWTLRWRSVVASPRPTVAAAVVAVSFALAARLPYFIRADFPLNDGGMFLQMSRDILNAHYALPMFTSYNSGTIPFAYPPLPFYLVAIISGITHLDPFWLVMYLPLVANLVTVVLVAFLARSLLGAGPATWIAPTVFALIPRSYEWMIMGGGLTRSVGFMFAVACLWQTAELFRRQSFRRTVVCGLLGAATLTSHLELAVFLVYSLLGMALLRGRSIRAILLGISVTLLAIVFAAPWWGTVIIRHGMSPFDAASLTAYWSTISTSLNAFQHEVFPSGFLMSALGISAAIGAIACFLRGEFFLPFWLPAVYVWVPRSAASEASVPLALLAAVGVADVVVPGLARSLARSPRSGSPIFATSIIHRPVGLSYASRVMEAAGLLLLLGAVYIYSPKMLADPTTLDSLSVGDRQAMTWVAVNTPASAQFMVLSTSVAWETDRVGEWFPAITGRRSVLTPQGTEWLPLEAFSRAVCVHNSTRALASRSVNIDYFDEWARDRGLGYSYLYVSTAPDGPVNWTKLLASAEDSPNYEVVFQDSSATVLERKEPVRPFAGPAGLALVSRDCQSLADQPGTIQREYVLAYGNDAAWAWVQQHDLSLPSPPTVCRKLEGSILGDLGPVEAVCRTTSSPALEADGAR